MAKKSIRVLASALLFAILALSIATPVAAFDGRDGDNVVVGKDEVVNDDLYVGASTFTLDGTVKGDVLAAGELLTINGNVEGDVMAAGKTIVINGNVTGSIRIAGAVLYIGENAKIGGDVVAAGASLETRKGSTVGQDAVVFGAQTLLAGDIARNAKLFAGGTEIHGNIGGNVDTEVGNAKDEHAPMFFSSDSPVPVPNVRSGLTIDPAAKIGGNLTYTSPSELPFPGGVVTGTIKHVEPKVAPVVQPTANELLMTSMLATIRKMVTLIILGLLLGWLFPGFLSFTVNRARMAPWPSLGLGIISFAAFFFALLVVVIATVIIAIMFGALTLGGLSVTVVFLGILGTFILIFGFILAMAFVAQIIVSTLGGKLILEKIKPEWAENKVWPLVVGVVIFAILTAIPILGQFTGLLVILLGLGVLWTYGSMLVAKKPAL